MPINTIYENGGYKHFTLEHNIQAQPATSSTPPPAEVDGHRKVLDMHWTTIIISKVNAVYDDPEEELGLPDAHIMTSSGWTKEIGFTIKMLILKVNRVKALGFKKHTTK